MNFYESNKSLRFSRACRRLPALQTRKSAAAIRASGLCLGAAPARGHTAPQGRGHTAPAGEGAHGSVGEGAHSSTGEGAHGSAGEGAHGSAGGVGGPRALQDPQRLLGRMRQRLPGPGASSLRGRTARGPRAASPAHSAPPSCSRVVRVVRCDRHQPDKHLPMIKSQRQRQATRHLSPPALQAEAAGSSR